MDKKYSVWIFAGEASGDIYGASIATEIKKLAGNDCIVSGMGGIEMRKAGVNLLVDSSELGVMGAVEAIGKILKCIGVFRQLYKRAVEERPDLVLLIDYPGFNIRFAKKMFENNIPVIWYISPQVWAWRKSNIPKLARYCRKMLVIFPFEPDVYSGSGLEVEFTGHPLIDIVNARKDSSISRDDNLVLLLPGSRTGEINRLFVPMLETIMILGKKKPGLKFVISSPREKITELLKEKLTLFVQKNGDMPSIEIKTGETGYWLQKASAGLAASGTITVESTIAGLPLVVIYKINPFSFFLGRMIITLFRGFFTMTNIIAEKEVFQEFLQDKVKPDLLAEAMERILPDGSRRAGVEMDMKRVVSLLGGNGACARAAEACFKFLKKN